MSYRSVGKRALASLRRLAETAQTGTSLGALPPSLKELREEQREEERREFAEVIAHFKLSVMANRRPTWLLLSVNKIDLYPAEFDSLVQHYSPNGSSEMSRHLRELVGFVGAGNFAWEDPSRMADPRA